MDTTAADLAKVHLALVAQIDALATAVLASTAPDALEQRTAACELLQGVADDMATTIEECCVFTVIP